MRKNLPKWHNKTYSEIVEAYTREDETPSEVRKRVNRLLLVEIGLGTATLRRGRFVLKDTTRYTK